MYPPTEVCAKPRQPIHCTCTKIGIGRGLELLSETGCLRGERASGATGYARWKVQRPVAFLNRKKSKHSDKERIARALAHSCRTVVRRMTCFSIDERVL